MSSVLFKSIMDYLDRKKPNLLIDAGFLISQELKDKLKDEGFKVVDIRFATPSNKLTKVIKIKKEHERGIYPLIIITSWRDVGDNKYIKDRMNVIMVSGDSEISDAITRSSHCLDYKCWFEITRKVAEWKTYCKDTNLRKHILALLEKHIDKNFQEFILQNFSNLVSSPSLCVHTIWNQIKEDKALLIIMDGMALDDWYAIREFFEYEEKELFALIPTLTSISRPAAVSGKLPRDYNGKSEKVLVESWGGIYINGDTSKLLQEIKEGSTGKIVFIYRYPDELMHAELQSKIVMYERFKEHIKNNLLKVIAEALRHSWNIYLSADHGNIECWNNYSKKIPQYADRDGSRCLEIPGKHSLPEDLKEKVITVSNEIFGYLENEKYYSLPKGRWAFTKRHFTVTHGGITPEEVIVPFIKIIEVRI